MGKSPGKWIKTVLFGKKSTRSKGRNASLTGDKGYNSGKGSPTLTVSSPVISGPVLVSIESNGIVPEAEKGTTSISSEAITLDTSQNLEKEASVGSTLSNDPERMKEEQAAIKAQAAFRGFLARRAFHALRGIIRLQALVRGHLVRRQAVATLRSMQGIVRLQALVRGQRVRRSGVGLEAFTKFGHAHVADDVPLISWKDKVATNAFICKLLSSSPAAMPLQVQYDNGDSNSVFCWLERWTSSYTWKPLPQPKKASDSKSRTKRGSYAMEMETSKPKRTVRRNSSGGVESGPTIITSEPEKSKRNTKKTSSTPTELPQEHPQTELEKVKRSLRKVSSLMAEASDRPDAEIEKTNRSIKKVSNPLSVPQDLPIDESAEKAKNEISVTTDVKPNAESALETVAVEGEAVALLDISPVESYPLQSIDKEEKEMASTSSMLLYLLTVFIVKSTANFISEVEITWGNGRGKISENGNLLTLSLDRGSGSGFQSKQQYLFGKIDIQMKLVPGNSAGTVTTYYLSSQGPAHDEIDFEFLGNVTGEPYVLHTNVFSQGKGNREQQFYLWFDPRQDFHTYSIVWNQQQIHFYVDGTPIRVFKNAESLGVPYPKNQPMRLYSTLWDAEDWATRGGLEKTNWALAPFVASYRAYAADACVWYGGKSSCPEGPLNSGWGQSLDAGGVQKMNWVRKNYMIYDYCKDTPRFPQGFPPECSL